jgi:hypothetical protein
MRFVFDYAVRSSLVGGLQKLHTAIECAHIVITIHQDYMLWISCYSVHCDCTTPVPEHK